MKVWKYSYSVKPLLVQYNKYIFTPMKNCQKDIKAKRQNLNWVNSKTNMRLKRCFIKVNIFLQKKMIKTGSNGATQKVSEGFHLRKRYFCPPPLSYETSAIIRHLYQVRYHLEKHLFCPGIKGWQNLWDNFSCFFQTPFYHYIEETPTRILN